MKQIIIGLVGSFLCFSLYAQTLNNPRNDTLLKKAVEKCSVEIVSREFDYTTADSTEIVYIRVKKQRDSLQVTTLYSSFKSYRLDMERVINSKPFWRYTMSMPNGYTRIIPIYFSIETNNGSLAVPTKQQEATAINALKMKDKMLTALPPVRVFIYQPVRKAAYNIGFAIWWLLNKC